MQNAYVKLDKVSKIYKMGEVKIKAVDEIGFEISKGEFVFIIGASGSGKSTLIKLLYRQEKPSRGEVYVGGVNVSKLRNGKVYKLRRKLGIVFQDYKLLPKLTVYENVAFALEVYGLPESDIRKRTLKAIEQVGLKDKLRSYPDELSGGEQQRVSIARAIVNDPKVLICDEPTGNLDPETSMEIMNVIDNINKDLGTTIIMATHDKEIVNKMKKRVIVIEKGLVAKDTMKGRYKSEGI